MAYFLISDFRAGLDARRLTESAAAGTLRELRNAFVNAGAEVEKLQGFVEVPWLTAALAEATVAGGWVGPVRTADGGFLFAGPGAIPSSFQNFIGTVPAYWSQLSNPLPEPEGLTGSDLFGTNAYLSVRYDQFGGVKHYFGQPGQALTEITDENTSALQEPHVKTAASKVFRAKSNLLKYSDVNDPTRVSTAEGGGLIDVTTSQGAIGPITGLGAFGSQLAVFGTSGVQIWTVDPDPSPATTFLSDVVGGINVVSGRTILTYDNQDLLFLTPNGVRSLQAQSISSGAAVDDIGTPVDELVRQAVLTGEATPQGLESLIGLDQSAFSAPGPERTFSVIEPITGQFWVVIGGVIFILSRFRGSKVRAWSTANLPNAFKGSNAFIKGATSAGDRMLFATTDDTAYLYGGSVGLDYDQTPAIAATPFLDFGDPAASKNFYALDVVARGRWQVEAAFDPSRPTDYEFLAEVEGNTTTMHQISMTGRSTHVSLRFTSTDDSTVATLSKAALHFSEGRKG